MEVSCSISTFRSRRRWMLAAAAVLVATLVGTRGRRGEAAEPTDAHPLRFVVVGHTYRSLQHAAQRQQLIDAVNAEQPNYVFFLGDCAIWDKAVADAYAAGIDAPTFSVPGNHDFYEDRREKYLGNVGYLDKVVPTERCNFVLINSSESAAAINAFLESALSQVDDSLPTIVLAHHRIWDDNLLSQSPYEHDKSFAFDNLHPSLRRHVDYIFAGNSPQQYFAKPRVNPHVVHWCDIVDGIECYSCGMDRRLSYLVAEVNGGRVVVTPRSHEIVGVSSVRQSPAAKIADRVFGVWQFKRFWIGVVCGGLAVGALFTLRGYLRRGDSRSGAAAGLSSSADARLSERIAATVRTG